MCERVAFAPPVAMESKEEEEEEEVAVEGEQANYGLMDVQEDGLFLSFASVEANALQKTP